MKNPNKEILSPSSPRKNKSSKRASNIRHTRSNSLDNSDEDLSVEEIVDIDSSEESDLELKFNDPKQVEPFENVSCPNISPSNPHSSWYYSRIYSIDMYNNLEKHFAAFDGVYLSKALLGELFHEKMTDLTVNYDVKITFEGVQVSSISNVFSCGRKKRLELKGISLKTADNKNESEDERRRIFLVHGCLAELLHATLKEGDILIAFSNGSWVLDSPVIPLNARMQNSLIGHYRHNGIFAPPGFNKVGDDDDNDEEFISRIDSSNFNIVYQEHEEENEMVMKITPVIRADPDENNNNEQERNEQNFTIQQQRTSPRSLTYSMSSNSSVVSNLSPGKADSVSSMNSSRSNRINHKIANENVGDKSTSPCSSIEELNKINDGEEEEHEDRASISSPKQNQTLKTPVQSPSASIQKRKRSSSTESIESIESTSKKKKTQTPSTTTPTKKNINTTNDNQLENNQHDLEDRPSSSNTNTKSKATTNDDLEEDDILELLGQGQDKENEIESLVEEIEEHDNAEPTTNNNNDNDEEQEEQDSSINPYKNMPPHTQIFNDSNSQTFFTTPGKIKVLAGCSMNVVIDGKKKESPRKKPSPVKKAKDSSDSDSDSDLDSSREDRDQILISYDPSETNDSCMEDDSDSDSFKSAFSNRVLSPKKNKEEESENNQIQSTHVKDCIVVVQKLKTSDVQACLSNNMSINLLKVQSSPFRVNQNNLATSSSSSSTIHRINSPRRSPRKTNNNIILSPAKSSSSKTSVKSKK